MTSAETVSAHSGMARRWRSLLARAGKIRAAGSERDRAQRNAMSAFLVRVASAALLYASQIVLARWMGASEYGIYVFVWTWVLVLGGLSHLGLSVAMIRLVPQYSAAGELELLRGLLSGGRWLALGLGTLVALAGGLGLFLLGDRIENHYVLPAYLALVCVPVYALTDLQDGIGRGRGWMGLALLPPYVLRPLLVLLAMIAAQAGGLAMTAATATAAAIAATWLAGLVQTVLVARRFRAEIGPGERAYDVRAWATTSLPLLAIYACELVTQNVDIIVLSLYRTPAEVGMYFAAAKTMALVMFVHYAVGSAAANRFATLHATGDAAALKAFMRDAVHWTFWPSLAAAVVIVAFGKPLLWLFSPGFADAYPVMFVLAAGFLVRASMGPAEFLLNMAGEQRLCAAVLAATCALNLVLSVLLVPRHGLMGAAVANAAALSVAAVLNAVVARRRLGISISILSLLGGQAVERPRA